MTFAVTQIGVHDRYNHDHHSIAVVSVVAVTAPSCLGRFASCHLGGPFYQVFHIAVIVVMIIVVVGAAISIDVSVIVFAVIVVSVAVTVVAAAVALALPRLSLSLPSACSS